MREVGIPIECRPAVFHVDGLREEYSQDMVEKKRQEEPKFAEKSRKRSADEEISIAERVKTFRRK